MLLFTNPILVNPMSPTHLYKIFVLSETLRNVAIQTSSMPFMNSFKLTLEPQVNTTDQWPPTIWPLESMCPIAATCGHALGHSSGQMLKMVNTAAQ